jgi:hypothetical protein
VRIEPGGGRSLAIDLLRVTGYCNDHDRRHESPVSGDANRKSRRRQSSITRLSSRDHFGTPIRRRRLKTFEISTNPSGTAFAVDPLRLYDGIPAAPGVPEVRR